MKVILDSKKHDYMKTAVIFLVLVTLMAAMLGCVEAKYDLRIDSTEGGEVRTPGEGRFSRGEGTSVNLVAKPDEGYRFVNWTGDVDTIADVNAAATSITMDGHHSIKANFALEILEVYTWYDLAAIRSNLAGTYVLMNSLNHTTANYTELASSTANTREGWEPVGTWRHPFTGSFDGQGYEIEDLFVNRPDKDYVGLFGYVDKGGIIKEIGVTNATVSGKDSVGGLVGRSEGGSVSKSYCTGNVTGEDNVGGLVGWNEGGDVSSSNSTSSVTGEDNVGGLVGWNDGGDVSSSNSTSSVTGEDNVGGLVGWNEGGNVSNSYSTGSVIGGSRVGGLVGCTDEESSVSNSYSIGNVTGEDGVGGLVGFSNKSRVSNSHYDYDEVLINDQNMITVGALFGADFDGWLSKNKSLSISGRLFQEDGYYVVNNVTDFKELLAFGQDDSLKFRLENDLNLNDESNFYIPYFSGEFDGNGHKISNLSLSFDFVYNAGLFGCLAPGGRVSKLGVEDVDMTGGNCVGGLVGSTWEGKVSDSYSTGNITGNDYVGGLMGSNNAGKVDSCNSRGSVTGNWYVGGLLGCNYPDEEAIANNCSCTGSVTGNRRVGGLVGHNRGIVSNSFSASRVTHGDVVGGLVGWNEGSVSQSFSIGSVAVTQGEVVGGLVGWNGASVSNSYSTGNVSGNRWVGGLVGVNGAKGKVNRCYSAGNVSGSQHVGGLVGRKDEGGEVTRCFWDTQTSGQTSSAAGTPKNTAQMKSSRTFTQWDITPVINPETPNTRYDWNIVEGETYPFLNWQFGFWPV
jgi:hypothetical protein